ncbi:MAG: histidine phosphatase family protein [Acidimicrobiales bacterium]
MSTAAPGGGPNPLAAYALPLAEAFLSGGEGITEVLLTRHAKQDIPTGPDATPADWVDPPLSGLGRRQADNLGRNLADLSLDAVYASTLRRAGDTAQAVAAHHGLAVRTLAELREIELYRDVPTGRPISEAIPATLIDGVRARFLRDRSWDAFPLSESSAAFRQRVVAAVEGIVAAHPGERVLVACHGGVINAYLAWALQLGADMFFRPGHASVSRFAARGDRRALRSLNEQHHLAAEDPSLVTV